MVINRVHVERADGCDLLCRAKLKAVFRKGGVYTRRNTARFPSRPRDGLRKSVHSLRRVDLFEVSKSLNFDSQRSFLLHRSRLPETVVRATGTGRSRWRWPKSG